MRKGNSAQWPPANFALDWITNWQKNVNRPVCVIDTEIYKDYFLVMFRNVRSEYVQSFECHAGQKLHVKVIAEILKDYQIVTFNGNNFDIPLLSLALKGADCATIKAACDAIIQNNLKPWDLEKKFRFKLLQDLDHVDLIEVAPGQASLKIYGARLHCEELQDLPFEPSESITPERRPVVRNYCAKDLRNTERLYKHLLPQIELREKMSAKYGMDLRSKSDAQIAEAVIVDEVSKVMGAPVIRPEVAYGTTFKYIRPACIRFTSDVLWNLANLIDGLEFSLTANGSAGLPKELDEADIRIGSTSYKMGIGGIHSQEKSTAHVADADHILIDRDVASYYPAIILANNWAPDHMGSAFTKSYRAIVERRLEAKRAGDKVTAEALKICVNGSFGKLGSKWSKLYAPHLLIQTTITGQLALLMLIEALEAFGIPVVSANTDGVVIKCPTDSVFVMNLIVADWEQRTGFTTEATEYAAIYSRDVNNYMAFKTDGLAKFKGAYAIAGLQKNPTNEICVEAAAKFLKYGTALAETIMGCDDIRKFVSVKKVAGGAVKDDVYLGKAVRWYYSTTAKGAITYKVNGRKVAMTDGAQPMMDIPATFPADVDYHWYVKEAESILQDVGATPAAQGTLFNRG